MRIIQLPTAVANQIAAGEVIERPASIVKELLENSFDAGANNVSIEINYGGLNQIKISDNGQGILAEDLPLAISAHATSKIKCLDDLYAIQSMGFRGEALASIASVSKLTITSKTASQDHAMSLQILGNDIKILPSARATGTTVDVCDIFYNAPVRKRFLKNENVEFQAIEAVVKCFALSAPHIAISLKHNGKLCLSLLAASVGSTHRITKLFGTTFIKNAIQLDVFHANMRLQGWISAHNFQRSNRDKLWVYINQRMVRDKLIHHALKQVYEDILHPGRFPACLLYLSIPNAEVDVNVHPTKHEVRFVQPRLIHDFFTSQLTRALEAHTPKPPKLSEAHIQDGRVATTFSRDFSQALQPIVHSYIALNSRYVLIFNKALPYLVDLFPFYQEKTLKQLSQMPLPYAKRSLLVPIGIDFSQIDKISGLEMDLAQLGFHWTFTPEGKVILSSIPEALPHLDIQLFFKLLEKETINNMDNILNILSHSQMIDASNLSSDDKMELNQYVALNMKVKSWIKEFTLENCRMCMYD